MDIMMVLTLLIMAVFFIVTLKSAKNVIGKEKRLGYPKPQESIDDVLFLLKEQNDEILAIRCYRRIHSCSLKIAKKAIEQL